MIPMQVKLMSDRALEAALRQLRRGETYQERWEDRQEEILMEITRREQGDLAERRPA